MNPGPSDIVLCTLNASFIHAAFGLRYLMANLPTALRPRAVIREFTINQRPLDIVERLLAEKPRLIGFGVYIWNAVETLAVVRLLKALRPDILIVLGGPEVSHECDRQEIVRLADYTITGEADLAFGQLCAQLLAGEKPPLKIIAASLPKFDALALPYDLYTGDDLAHRVVYIEASRGCPFTCEFCLSSLDIPVRALPLDRLLPALDRLIGRGLRQFKFVDRTFNLHLPTSRAILEFFLDRYQPGHFFHFEMVPDRLPEGLREIIARFPPGALQFEVGIQTFDPHVAANISRRNHLGRLEDNLRFLREKTGVHVHADLIAGLPGETVESFAAGFDRLVAMGPQEIQVGILKRLRGTPIVRHDAEWAMVYSPDPPYEVLRTRTISFDEMQALRRFAKYWDLVANSGNFLATTPLLWSETADLPSPGPFRAFQAFADWLSAQTGRTDGIALLRLVESFFRYLTEIRRLDAAEVARTLWTDYTRSGRRDAPPAFLAPHLPLSAKRSHSVGKALAPPPKTVEPARQRRFLGQDG